MKITHNHLNSNASTLIKWDKPMLARFLAVYSEAISSDRETFLFDNYGYSVGYAYYLISFLQKELAT
jgi:hypothetical protein